MHGLQACSCKYITVAMLSVVKMSLKGEVGGCALNSHKNYIVDHGKSWKNHGIVFLGFCGNPGLITINGNGKFSAMLCTCYSFHLVR